MPRSFLIKKATARCRTRNPAIQPTATVPLHCHSESVTRQANPTDPVVERPSAPADNATEIIDAERRGGTDTEPATLSSIAVSMATEGCSPQSANEGDIHSPTDFTKTIFNGIFQIFNNGKILSNSHILYKSEATNSNPRTHADLTQLRSTKPYLSNGEASLNLRSHSELTLTEATHLQKNNGEVSPNPGSHSDLSLLRATHPQNDGETSPNPRSHSEPTLTEVTHLQKNNGEKNPNPRTDLDSILLLATHPQQYNATPSPSSSLRLLEENPLNTCKSFPDTRLGTTIGYTYETFMCSDGRSKRKMLSSASQTPVAATGDAHHPCQTRYRCVDCGRHYATSSNLSRHRQTHRSLDSQHAKQCPHCRKVYVSMPALAMHVLTHDLKYRCTVCAKAFSRPWLLRGHLRSHTGEKPFGCAHCGKAFADRSNLRAHMQTHSTLKHFRCQRCNKPFGLRSRSSQIVDDDPRTVVDDETNSSLTSCPTV